MAPVGSRLGDRRRGMTSRLAPDHDLLSFDDFEELLANKPKGERWKLLADGWSS